MVRNLLKDVHFFSNGFSAFSGPVNNSYLCQATDRLRKSVDCRAFASFNVAICFRSIIPAYFQKKVYQFLRHTFKHWGMDRTFRIVRGILCVCVHVCVVCMHGWIYV